MRIKTMLINEDAFHHGSAFVAVFNISKSIFSSSFGQACSPFPSN